MALTADQRKAMFSKGKPNQDLTTLMVIELRQKKVPLGTIIGGLQKADVPDRMIKKAVDDSTPIDIDSPEGRKMVNDINRHANNFRLAQKLKEK